MTNLRFLKNNSSKITSFKNGDVIFDDSDKTIKVYNNGLIPYKGTIDTTFNPSSTNPATSSAINSYLETYTYSAQQKRDPHAVLAGNASGGATFRSLTSEDLPNIDLLKNVDACKIKFTKTYSYSELGIAPSADTHDFIKLYLKQLIIDYPNQSEILFISKVAPDSVGFCWVYFYNTRDIINDLPQYCFGQFAKLETTCNINFFFNAVNGIYTYKKMTNDELLWTEWE